MIANKHITKLITVLMAAAVLLCLLAGMFSGQLTEAAGGTGVEMEYETALFDTDTPMSVNILMDEDEWEELLDNALSEEYYQCDVEINGETFYNVGIRAKGNTSLSSIANDPTTERYSLKLEFDKYQDGQTCYGLDKLVLNNDYADATNMKEALIYDMYQFLDADASLYNYAKISVNGEYWGVYLALEAVEDSFLTRNYGVSGGELYKPDGMDMDGGMGDAGAADASSQMPQDAGGMGGAAPESTDITGAESTNTDGTDTGSAASDGTTGTEVPSGDPGGGFPAGDVQQPDMQTDGNDAGFNPTDADDAGGGGGADLNYTDDDLDSYSTIWDGAVTDTSDADHERVVTALKNISEGTELETYMDIDNLLKYMAVHVFSVNSDSLTGMMAHNYYLYEQDGQLNLIPWDYNLALGGMEGGSDATSVVNDAIDDAFTGTDFFDTLMENETYHDQYYAYLQQLVDEYLLGDGFETFYNRTRSQIDTLVETDPNAFYTYDEYETAVQTLYETVQLRAQSIDGQLNGTIPSTSDAQNGSGALIDASSIDLSVMGSMNEDDDMRSQMTDTANTQGEQMTDGETNEPTSAQTAQTAPNAGQTPPNGNMGAAGNTGAAGMGDANSPPTQNAATDGGTAATDEGTAAVNGGTTAAGGETAATDESMPQIGTEDGASVIRTLAIYGVCAALLIAALIFAICFRRRPRGSGRKTG